MEPRGVPSFERDVTVRMFGLVEIENLFGKVGEKAIQATPSLSWLLMKYLLVNRGREVSQVELLENLWPDKPHINADGASRVRLRRLREALRPIFLEGKDGLVLFSDSFYTLNPNYDLHTDEEALLDLMQKIRRTPLDEPGGLELCEEALSVYRGKFMELTPLAPWLEKYRSQYAKVFSELGNSFLDRMAALDDYSFLTMLSCRAVAILPEEEALHMRIIRCLMKKMQQPEVIHHIAGLLRENNPTGGWIEKYI